MNEVCQNLMKSYEFHSSTLIMASFRGSCLNPKGFLQFKSSTPETFDLICEYFWSCWDEVTQMFDSFRKGWTTPININMSMFRGILLIHLGISRMKVDGLKCVKVLHN